MEEYLKTTLADLRATEFAKLREMQIAIRRELTKMKMDIYTAPAANAAKGKALKRVLAQSLTVIREHYIKNPRPKKVVAPLAKKTVTAAAGAGTEKPKKATPAKTASAAPKAAKTAEKAKPTKKSKE